MVSIKQPRTIVRSEDNARIVIDLMTLQFGEDLAHSPIDLADDVAKQAP